MKRFGEARLVLGAVVTMTAFAPRDGHPGTCTETVDTSTVTGTIVDERGVVSLEEGEATITFDEWSLDVTIGLPRTDDLYWAIRVALPGEEGRVDTYEPQEGGERLEFVGAELCSCSQAWEYYCADEAGARCIPLGGAFEVDVTDDCAGACETAFELRLVGASDDGRAFDLVATRDFETVDVGGSCSSHGCRLFGPGY